MASNQIAIHYIYVYIYIIYIYRYIFLDPKGSDSWLERTGCRTVDRVFLGVAHQSLYQINMHSHHPPNQLEMGDLRPPEPRARREPHEQHGFSLVSRHRSSVRTAALRVASDLKSLEVRTAVGQLSGQAATQFEPAREERTNAGGSRSSKKRGITDDYRVVQLTPRSRWSGMFLRLLSW